MYFLNVIRNMGLKRFMKEKPAAILPWHGINKLLAPDEKFEVTDIHWKGFLVAPKQRSQLAALLFFLYSENIAFCIAGRGFTSRTRDDPPLVVSARAFSNILLYNESIVEVGAGATIQQLQQFLYERKQEVCFEEGPLDSSKRSIASLILSGTNSCLHLRNETLQNTIVGVELITLDGSQIKYGGAHRTLLAGPALHKSIWKKGIYPGIITKFYLKTFPIPQSRLRLTWKFPDQAHAKNHLQQLKKNIFSWENLEFVQSGNSDEQSYIFAQISGFEEELSVFSDMCPLFDKASKKNVRITIKKFLNQQLFKAYLTRSNHLLNPGEYFWSQELSEQKWLLKKCEEGCGSKS